MKKIRSTFALRGGLIIAILLMPQAAAFGATAIPKGTATLPVPASCDLVLNGVKARIAPIGEVPVAGGDLDLSVTLSNENAYPVRGMDVVARISKLAQKAGDAYAMATDTVARIDLAKGVSLSTGESREIALAWHMPANLVAGPYRVDIFANSGDSAVGGNEYLGVPAGSYPVRIAGGTKEVSFLKPSSVAVNGAKPFANLVADVRSASNAVSVVAQSTHSKAVSATMRWRVYSSYFADEAALVTTKSEAVTIPAGGTQAVSYSFSGAEKGTYLVVGELVDQSKVSRVAVRLNRTDKPEPVVRSLVLSDFPLSSSGATPVFGCIADSSNGNLPATAVKVTLTDAKGSVVYSGAFHKTPSNPFLQFIGNILPNIKAENPLTLALTAYAADGSVIAAKSVVYSCDDGSCDQSSGEDTATYAGIVALALLAIAALLVWEKKHRKQL
ncbi:MAG TPA: hypothetical protein VHE10_02000 [Candidatus Paceibacterota bacterium]|nr:hypothetical protein [Candidatus Paceibacterota bacterium]